jgi:hypothetical protein
LASPTRHFPSMLLMYFEKSLNSSMVGRNTGISSKEYSSLATEDDDEEETPFPRWCVDSGTEGPRTESEEFVIRGGGGSGKEVVEEGVMDEVVVEEVVDGVEEEDEEEEVMIECDVADVADGGDWGEEGEEEDEGSRSILDEGGPRRTEKVGFEEEWENGKKKEKNEKKKKMKTEKKGERK